MLRGLPILIFLTTLASYSWAQEQRKDSLHLKLKQVFSELDSLFNTTDSSSAIDLIDGFLAAKAPKDTSQLVLRIGYNSNISAMNQTLGIRQFGFSPAVSYFHRSGLYGDISSYWSKQFLPTIYLNIFSAGYLKAFSKSYLFNLEYSYFNYSASGQDVSAPYTNSFSITNQFDFKPLQFKLDYYYYFGTQNAHRVLPTFGFVLEKKNWGKVQRLTFTPTLGILLGTESSEQFLALQLTSQQALDRIKNGLSLYKTTTVTVFGLMNYSFTFPISVKSAKWNYQLSYTYNIPRSLPDEELALTNTSYISASVARYLKFK